MTNNTQYYKMTPNDKWTYLKPHNNVAVNDEYDDIQNIIHQNRAGNIDYNYNYNVLLKDLSKLRDIDKAYELIANHVDGSHIAIVTDQDSDGINSCVTIYKILIDIYKIPISNISVIINRRKNGNGYTDYLVNEILAVHEENKIDLIISADHGSSDNLAFGLLKTKNIDLLITDHHTVKMDNYPVNADVFINNQRDDSDYSKHVSGCFIAFGVLLYAYCKIFNTKDISVFNQVMPYVALSTITDVMSLSSPINRFVTRVGVNEINSCRNSSWVAIKKLAGINGPIVFKDLGFKIGPLINTANRVDREMLGFRLLAANNYYEAMEYGEELIILSTLRKRVQRNLEKTTSIAIEINKYKHSLVLVIDTPLAINGIIAAKDGDKVKLPTICFTDSEGSTLVGSGRGILKGYDILSTLQNIHGEDSSILIKFGGHTGAAGCSIHKDKLELFKELFDKYSKEQITSLNTGKHILRVDCYLPNKDITPITARAVQLLGPYGKDWQEPLFISNVKFIRAIPMGSVMKLVVDTKYFKNVSCMIFNLESDEITSSNIKRTLTYGENITIIYSIALDSYKGSNSLMLNVKYISKCEKG